MRSIGEDVSAAELLLPAGHRLRAVDVAAAGAAGATELAVRRRPVVTVIPTGDEIRPVGTELKDGELPDTNGVMLAAQAEAAGCEAHRFEITPDVPEQIAEAVRAAAARSDLVIVIAGSSAGRDDHTAEVVASVGTLAVHGVAVRPGHPVVLGVVHGDPATPVLGAPGYPVSAALTFDIFAAPLLARLEGAPPPEAPVARARLARKLASTMGMDDWVRVRLGRVGGQLVATPLPRGAGVLTSLVRADGLLVVPAALEGHHAGEDVTVRLLRGVGEIERTIVATGSHDLVLDLAASALRERDPRVTLASSNVGSLGGLTALRDGLCHVAGSHLLDPATGEYTLPYLEKLLPRAGRRGGAARASGSGTHRRARQSDRNDRHRGCRFDGGCGTSIVSAGRARGCCSTTSSRGMGSSPTRSTATRARSTPTSPWPRRWRRGGRTAGSACWRPRGRSGWASCRWRGSRMTWCFSTTALRMSCSRPSGPCFESAEFPAGGGGLWAATTPPKWAAGSADPGPCLRLPRISGLMPTRFRIRAPSMLFRPPRGPDRRPGRSVMFVSTRRAAAAAAASARITPVSASPRTAGDADSATFTPSSATSAAVSAICAGGSLAPSRAVVRSAGVSAFEDRLVGGELLLGEPQRVARACSSAASAADPRVGSPSRAAISTSAAASATVTAEDVPPPGAGVSSPTESRNSSSDWSRRSATRGYGSGVVTDEQVESFRSDGFLIIEEGLIPMSTVEVLRERFAAIFEGEYSTGIAPDEVNWKKGRDRDDVTRQICNGWRADDLIAAQVLSEKTGRIAARLGGYRGTRMLQDNCLWKPPGTKSLGMHQDGSYADYLSPPEMITCWVALDETFAQGGTIEYVRGSHLWPKAPPDRGSFHAPDDWLAPLDERGARGSRDRARARWW